MHFFIPEGKSFDSPEEDLSPGTTGSLLEGVTEPIHKIFVEREDLGDFLALHLLILKVRQRISNHYQYLTSNNLRDPRPRYGAGPMRKLHRGR